MSTKKVRPVPVITEKTLIKFLRGDGRTPIARKRIAVGEWIKIKGDLQMCSNGIHVTRLSKAEMWQDATCHVVEVRGEFKRSRDKICCREVYIHPANENWHTKTRTVFNNVIWAFGSDIAAKTMVAILNGRLSGREIDGLCKIYEVKR